LLSILSLGPWANGHVTKTIIENLERILDLNLLYFAYSTEGNSVTYGKYTTANAHSIKLFLDGGQRLSSKMAVTNYSPNRNLLGAPKRILIISHEDKQSGAPLFAKRIAESLHHASCEVKILIFSGDEPAGIFQIPE